MTERQVNCYKCGADGHIARACPQCTKHITQPIMPATTVENQAISPKTAQRPNKKTTDLPDSRITTTNAQIPSASTAEATDIWPAIAEKVTHMPMQRKEDPNATTAAKKATSQGNAITKESRESREGHVSQENPGRTQANATTAMKLVILQGIAQVSYTFMQIKRDWYSLNC